MANYYHPHVAITTTANRHSVTVAEVPDTTILFAAIIANKGKDGLTKVHTLAEFVNEFGAMDKDFYAVNGQMAYNIYNWLSNGGTLLAYKLKGTVSQSNTIEAGTVFDIKNIKYHTNSNDDVYSVYEFTEPNVGISVPTGKTYYLADLVDANGNIAFSIKKNGETVEFDNAPKIYVKTAESTSIATMSANLTYNDSSKLYTISVTNGDSAINIATFTAAETDVIPAAVNGKYSGNAYNVSVVVTKSGASYDIQVKKDRSVLERMTNISEAKLEKVLAASEYLDVSSADAFKTLSDGEHTIQLTGGAAAATSYTGAITKIRSFWSTSESGTTAKSVLKSRLENPVDVIMDAGYPGDIKKNMINFIKDDAGVGVNTKTGDRPDIFGIFDVYQFTDGKPTQMSSVKQIVGERYTGSTGTNTFHMAAINSTNVAVYDQYFMIDDAIFNGQDIYVTPTYFLSKLIPYNDAAYGIQLPTAGLRRGILDDAISINFNPDSSEKETLFLDRVNYVEKTSREYAFMSQRTADASTQDNYTALSFVNNSRCLLKITKEIERMARQYLHEYNDAVTISNMQNALNKYLATWVSNRALTLGYADVSQSDLSENALVVTINVKFNNTIEVISVDIIID